MTESSGSFSGEDIHAEFLNSKGKTGVSVRKGKKKTWELDISEPGVYVLHGRTSDIAAPGGKSVVRYVTAQLSVSVPERDEPLVTSDTIKTGKKLALRFHVISNAKVTVVFTTLALVKPIKFKVHIAKKINVQPKVACVIQDGEQAEEMLSKLEEKLLDLNKLSSSKREKIESLCDLWPDEAQVDILHYPPEKYIEQLQRDSKYKQKAFDLGLIRPFLLLASMHPVRRLRWAKALKVPVLSNKNFGDAHAEALLMLTFDRKGLQARANHAFADSINPLGNDANWYQILFRVCRSAMMKDKKIEDDTRADMKEKKELRTFAKSIGICKSKDSSELHELEQVFALGIAQVLQFVVRDTDEEEYDRLQAGMQQAEFEPYLDKLRADGYTNEELMRFLCWVGENGGEACLFTWLGKWGKKAQEGTAGNKARIALPAFMIGVNAVIAVVMSLSPLIVIPISLLAINSAMFVWRETPGKLLVPLMGLTMQRFRLAVIGIHLEDYYPSA